jgi:hypothetical protein
MLEIQNLLRFLRSILNDTSLVRCIDESYESVILGEIAWIPESVDDDLLVYLNYFQILIKNINLLNLSKDFKKLHVQPSFSFNIKEIFISNVKNDRDLTSKNKAQIINLLTKFSAIFACFEELIKHPVKYIDRYAQKDDNQIL